MILISHNDFALHLSYHCTILHRYIPCPFSALLCVTGTIIGKLCSFFFLFLQTMFFKRPGLWLILVDASVWWQKCRWEEGRAADFSPTLSAPAVAYLP